MQKVITSFPIKEEFKNIKNKTKAKKSIEFIALLFLLVITLLRTGTVKADAAVGSYGFSIVQISDTQFLSSNNPSAWQQLTNWIIANNASYNIKMAVLTGDIVDSGDDPNQWVNANASISLLLNAGIPYTWDAGNHDQISDGGGFEGNPNGNWIGSQYLAFNSTFMASQPYWVSDVNDGKNTAVQFTYGNYNFLIINLEFHANQTALDWMTNLINAHLNYNVIVATHSYLNGAQSYGYPDSTDSPQWENDLTSILNCYPNVFLTMSGHCLPMDPYPQNGDAETSNYTNVNGREETFFNRQNVGEGAGGPEADSARIFTFNMTYSSNLSVQASTFDVYDNTWINDTWNLFSFQPTLINATTSVTPLPTPTPPPTPPSSPILTQSQPTITTYFTAASTPKPTPSATPKPTAPPAPTAKPTVKPTVTPKPTHSSKKNTALTHKKFNLIHGILKNLVQRLFVQNSKLALPMVLGNSLCQFKS